MEEGEYVSQFVSRVSNGGLSPEEGGTRDQWEKKLFGGAYHGVSHNPSLRPKYGALNLFYHQNGAAPRFGSCYLILNSRVHDRSTFTYHDSSTLHDKVGTKKNFHRIMSQMMIDLFQRNFALGEDNVSVNQVFMELKDRWQLPPLLLCPVISISISKHRFMGRLI